MCTKYKKKCQFNSPHKRISAKWHTYHVFLLSSIHITVVAENYTDYITVKWQIKPIKNQEVTILHSVLPSNYIQLALILTEHSPVSKRFYVDSIEAT